jgi:cell division protein FtsN
MPKDYKNINNRNSKAPSSSGGSILSFLTGLSIGLVVAVSVYVRDYSITDIEFFQKDKSVTEKDEPGLDDQTVNAESVTEPTFDFYTVLPNRKINISEYIAEDDDKVVTQNVDEEYIYIFQVGSFKEYSAADQVKAKLTLIGIDAKIQRVVINGQDSRHRVRIGPYTEPIEINEVRKRLFSNNLEFMLLKLRMEDATDG